MPPLNARTVWGGIALGACLVSAALALRGCPPTGVGSIKVGSPSQWHKEPTAPAPTWNSRKVPRKTQKVPSTNQAPYKSIKDVVKERTTSPA